MRTKTMRTTVKAMAAGLAMLAMGAPALAQTWKAERAAGRVGERSNGQLGVVGAGNAQLDKMVSDVNNERKALYFAKAGSSTPELFAQVTACTLIDGLKPDEKFQTPGGQWKARGTGALKVPDVLPICLQRAGE